MKVSGKTFALGVFAVALLVVVSCSYLLEPSEENTETDIVGTWYLVSCESLDQSQRYNRTVDSKYNLTVNDYADNMFTAEAQGVEFCGVMIGNTVVFEYRYGTIAWVRADGSMVNGMLVMYETHYYGENHWFVSISKYSKKDVKIKVTPSQNPSVGTSWNLQDGQSNYYDDTEADFNNGYSLQGKRFFISGMWGNLFRAEIQQDVGGVITTRLMNGVFVSSFDDVKIAFLIDTSGKMWTLTIQNDLAVLRAILMSDSLNKMVVTQRTYFDGIPPAVPDAPDMTGEWISDGYTGREGNGSEISDATEVKMEYLWQNEYVFTGVTHVSNLPEAGYAIYDPNAYNGWLIRIGTDISGDFKEGYVFLDDDDTMTLIEFNYASGKNSVRFYSFSRS